MSTIAGCGPDQVSENDLRFETLKGISNRDGSAKIVAGAAGWTITGSFALNGGLNVTDGDALTFGTPGTDLVMTADGTDVVVTATGDLVFNDAVDVAIGTGKDLKISHDGTNTTFLGANGDIIIDNTDVNDAIILRVGADSSATTIDLRNNSDVSLFSMIPSGAAAGDFKGLDNADIVIGTGNDLRINHNGTDTLLTSATGNFVVDNTSATGKIIERLGTNTSATAYEIRGDADTALVAVNGAGTVTFADGTTFQRPGAGTGTGDVIERIGASASEGMEVRVFEATVSPSAIETALLTLPANHVVDSVQANVQIALTGGGTTVTFSIGITGDVDSHGTAGAPTDLLTQNAKVNAIGIKAANAGASIGQFSGTTVDLKLIGAATGGASAGNTALTVGSVRVVVRYRVLVSLANA